MHIIAVLVISVLVGLLVADMHSMRMFFGAASAGAFQIDWLRLGIHLLLSAALWGFCVYGFSLLQQRKRQAVKLHRVRGSVMVETLIALVPFLLLTSGIAQYAMINVASLLSDLAVYQAARTAWIWQPEADSRRNGSSGYNRVTADDVKFRARTAAALALAPSASSDFTVGRNFPEGSGPPFRRIRTAVAATFNKTPISGQNFWTATGSNWSFFREDIIHGEHKDMSVSRAFDTGSFYLRAGRKVTSAWMGLEDFEVVHEGDRVGVEFTYQYSVIFPWFAYLFGTESRFGERDGYYIPITRKMTLLKQPGM